MTSPPTASDFDDETSSLVPGSADPRSQLPTRLEGLVEAARDYAKASGSENTRKAYASDWRHYTGWTRRHGLPTLPPDPQIVGLYIAACASGALTGKPGSVRTIERRLSALAWNFSQRGEVFDRSDRHVATVLAGIRRTQGRPPEQKEAVLSKDLVAMIATLDLGDLRGLRDRAILLVGFAGGLRRSEIVGLACHAEDALGGWFEKLADGILLTLRGKTGWREVEIGRGSSEATCPVVALETWLKFARIERGPIFRRVVGKSVGSEALTDKHVARLVKQTALAAGVRGDLSEGERAQKFSGHSLRAGLASSAEVDERYVQKQLGHASAEMTRRYQRRRDRFRVNLTKAAGL
jgi:integrase